MGFNSGFKGLISRISTIGQVTIDDRQEFGYQRGLDAARELGELSECIVEGTLETLAHK